MTIINVNSVSGINSITAQSNSVQFYTSSGGGGSISGINSITAQSTRVTFYNSSGGTTVISGISSISDSSNGYITNPPGTIITVASSTAPAGHLKANGASLSTTTYAELFAAIGYTFGGSGASFTLPDLRGEFIRGWDDARGVDSGRSFGSAQSQAIQSHTHGITVSGADDNNHTGNGSAAANSDAGYTATNSTEASGGTETRPRNIALLHCIKF
jgi:microcystin-dependent protein